MDTNEKRMADVVAGETSRRNFLKTAGLALAALTVSTTINPIGAGVAFAAENLKGLSDLDILNFALTLEHLEAVFYIEAVASGKLYGPRLTHIMTAIRDHEISHVNALTSTIKKLGGTPVKRQARYNFGSMGNQDVILKTAETLEGVGVGAYTGAAALIANKTAVLPAAASIEQVESRHYAAIRFLRGKDPTPAAFGPVLTVAEVLKAAGPILGN